jgi:hypothetical protein
MRTLHLLSAVCAILWMPTALGSECFSIHDADERIGCLAAVRAAPLRAVHGSRRHFAPVPNDYEKLG